MRLKFCVALPRSAFFAAAVATVLVMAGPVGAQISSTGTITSDGQSITVGPGNTNVSSTLEIGGTGTSGTVTVENSALLETGTSFPGPFGQFSMQIGGQNGSNGSLNILSGGDATANTGISVGSSSGTGTFTIDGVGSTFNSGASVNVGLSGTGTLNIQNGGSLTSSQFDVGSTFGNSPSVLGDGTVNLTGSGSSIQINNSSATIGQDASVGRMTISNNAQFTIGDGLDVGEGASSTGTLTIQSGADVVVTGNNGQSIGIGHSGATGTVTVDGTGSTLNSGSSIRVGSSTGAGLGTLNVQNGGSVDIDTLEIGTASSSSAGNGVVNLSGSGSVISTLPIVNLRTLTVGDSGSSSTGSTGILNITDGATFTSGGSATIADESTDTGTINISGAGSTLSTAGFFSVGSGGSGNLNIGDNPSTGGVESGGVVNSIRAGVATQNTADPSVVNVNGAGAQWNLLGTDTSDRGAMLQLAGRGNGTINVSNGGSITIDAQGTPTGSSQGGLQIGGFDGNPQATGTLNIDGAGSSVTNATGYVQFGRLGTGIVHVTNSGNLDTSGAVTNVVGRKVGATGTVNVTGSGSTWNAGNNIFIGTEVDLATSTSTGTGGNGTLNVANGGAVFAQDIINGASGRITGGGGTITGNIQNNGTIAAGNSPGLMTIIGNLDHNAGATIEVEIAGTTFNTGIPQFDYDRIDVSDDPATTGTTEGIFTIDPAAIFSVEFISGFSAASGDSFDILIADTISGLVTLSQFTILPTLTAGLSWELNVIDGSRDTIQLAVTGTAEAAVSEPGGLLILIGGVGVLALLRRRRTATIH